MPARCLLVASIFVASLAGAIVAPGAPLPQRTGPKDGPLGMKFVRLPKGTFYMGGGEAARKTEIEQDFEIAIHTVTQGQWQALMSNNPSCFSRDGKCNDQVKDIADADLKQFPVENVSWDDARDFIRRLNEENRGKGYLYRLPSEAEWEYACRGRAASKEECSYHFYFARPTNDLTLEQANFNGEFFGIPPSGKSLERTAKVGSYKPNKLGLYDMHGNVWQWCADLNEDGGALRVIRGGSWRDGGSGCVAGRRVLFPPTIRDYILGFRLVRVPSGGK